MLKININETTHLFEKQNLVTNKNGFDNVVCKKCGLKGKRTLETVFVARTKANAKKITTCNSNSSVATRVRILKQPSGNKSFENLTVGSEHEVIPSPESIYPNTATSVWISGAGGTPIRILKQEFEKIN